MSRQTPDSEEDSPSKTNFNCSSPSDHFFHPLPPRVFHFSVMVSHHVITVFLIGYSYLTRFFRVGSVILALHDASDVFLEAAKVFKYSGNEVGASVLFRLFAISLVVLRLVFFPFWVIRASSYYFVEHVPVNKSYNTLRYYVFNTLLLSLLVFHIYWWVLIYSMIMWQLKNRGKVEDIRSDSDDD